MSERKPAAAQKRVVAERAGGCCEYCLSPLTYSTDPFAIEHVTPRAVGGSNANDNLAFSCLGCNGYKFTSVEKVDPITKQIAPFYHPRRHEWSNHFAWNEDLTLLVGLTPTGRATIERLRLNREGVVNL